MVLQFVAPMSSHDPLTGKLDRLEDEVRINEAAIRLMSLDERSSMPEMLARLERLRALSKAARRCLSLARRIAGSPIKSYRAN
jgi:hypothetical protein